MSLVYFMRRADGTGPIKIGCSVYPEARRRQIGSDTKAVYVILAAAPGDRFTERNLHLKFAEHQEIQEWPDSRAYPLAGATEWFSAVPELLLLVEQTKREGSVPLAEDECRERVFARRYLAGDTLKAIGDDYGITRERVRQVLRKAGVPSLGHRSEIASRATMRAWRRRWSESAAA